MNVSVLTIVRGRQRHLANQYLGLLQSKCVPREWVIVGMDEEPRLTDEFGVRSTSDFSIRTSAINGKGNNLPLAEARNQAASLAKSDVLVFLDVDCIPDPMMIEHFRKAAEANRNSLWMGNACYLPQEAATMDWTFDTLRDAASNHPLQPRLEAGERVVSERYELFWSLCFCLSKRAFSKIGGFDQSFAGYGGEDTDFAFSARAAKVPFGFVGATAYHQYHPAYKPPLNHFHAVVSNARRFRKKWGTWPMESWLDAFADLGLVDIEGADLTVLRSPTSEEIESARTDTFAGV